MAFYSYFFVFSLFSLSLLQPDRLAHFSRRGKHLFGHFLESGSDNASIDALS